MINDALSFGLLSFTSLLTMIDPIAAAPMFVAITEDYETKARRQTAFKACAVAFTILIIFAFAGGLIFKVFGITLDALRIAGGILFFTLAMQMLSGKHSHDVAASDMDSAIIPLGMPVICGPGSISTIMVLMGQSRSPYHTVSLVLALTVVLLATAVVLILSPKILKVIGKTGITLLTKVIGLIICTIGIQFIIDGIKNIMARH